MAKKTAPSRARKVPQMHIAVREQAPAADLKRVVDWFKVAYWHPDFHTLKIQNNQVTAATWWCHAHRGFWMIVPDRVCWVNQDGNEHKIRFVGGRWPFKETEPSGGIPVPAYGASDWYTLKRDAPFGATVRYDYFVDTAGPPDGPAIISED